MVDHISNRNLILSKLFEELIGPAPAGEEVDISTLPLSFESKEGAYGPFIVKGSGEEILIRDNPSKRYGIGVLYPFGTEDKIEDRLDRAGKDAVGGFIEQNLENLDIPFEEHIHTEKITSQAGNINENLSTITKDDNPIDLDLSSSNEYQQSSIGITFLAILEKASVLELNFTGGRYFRIPVVIEGKELIWWARKPIQYVVRILPEQLLTHGNKIIRPSNYQPDYELNTEDLNMGFEVLIRNFGDSNSEKLITVSFVNRSLSSGRLDEGCIFQSKFEAKVISPNGIDNILPYPGAPISQLDKEEQSLALLYRNLPPYCIGHGCAGNWARDKEAHNATIVIAEPLPTFESPSTTPDIEDFNGTPISISMALLAGLKPEEGNGFDELEKLISTYKKWIEQKRNEVSSLPIELQPAANRNISACENSAIRMKDGLEFLKNDSLAYEAFRLANLSILMQQVRPREKRAMEFNNKSLTMGFEKMPEIKLLNPGKNRGNWRAFQIAFILMSVESISKGNHLEREIVELIWFPTGGGKTEAYLGIVAYSIFLRRLRDPDDQGVNVLMRYTLRLLTTQQFQRASKLILAMEMIRRDNIAKLGSKQISIGLWVGSANTPNKRSVALTSLRDLNKNTRLSSYQFVLDRCPWCGAEMGPVNYEKKPPKYAPKTLGLEQEGETVVYKCPDTNCEFSKGLPIYVIDEDVYEYRPSLVIGTVDKFAMLAWRPEARALFGFDESGTRICSPPGVIVQDELHLISGPLGSMVGLYETIIDELCTDRRNEIPVKPKIISSTATIRRYEEQILGLYGRNQASLFPPPGIDVGDSFFAKYKTTEAGDLAPGRLYVGIHAPGLGSLQTAQVRTFTALLQAPMALPEAERDPWWTLLLFFNSLRELGTTLSLLQSDIPDYRRVLINRLSQQEKSWRNFWEIKELTGRAENEDIPKALSQLEIQYPNETPRPIDVCLASSILEVGVDIDRLSLMSVVGQPKTTSQYIQVTGRVGRSWWTRPGLVATIYTASKPRDRSHYEKFRTYHERLYAQVEPTSVTPFSPPALDRALHAVIVAYARQRGDKGVADSPYPFPESLLGEIKTLLLPKVKTIDPDELDNFESVFDRIINNWKTWEKVKWSGDWGDDNDPLLRMAGSYAPQEKRLTSWETPMSMRSVDAECITEIADSLLQGEQ